MDADRPPYFQVKEIKPVDKRHDEKPKDAPEEPIAPGAASGGGPPYPEPLNRPDNLPEGAYWDSESGFYRDSTGHPISPG